MARQLKVVYVADEDRSNEVKRYMRPYPQDVSVGTVGGLGANPSYISDLCNSIMAQADRLDMVIFDQQSMAGALRGNKAALQAIMDAASIGIQRSVEVCVYDPDGIIRPKGRATLTKSGLRVIDDLSELGGAFERAYGTYVTEGSDVRDIDVTHHKDPRKILPVMADGAEDVARRDGVDLASGRDYFADARTVSSANLFNQFMDDRDPDVARERQRGDGRDGGRDGGAAVDGMDEDFDFDSIWGDAPQRDRPTVTLDEFYEEHLPGMVNQHDDEWYDEQRRRKEAYERSGAYDGMEELVWLVANPELGWEYDKICDSLAKKGTALWRSRNSKPKVGEVSNAMLYNSEYIPQQQQISGGVYQAPNECKIVSCYSLAGGSGKSLVRNTKMFRYNKNWSNYDTVTLDDIKVGDYILGADGIPIRVLGVYPQEDDLDVYRIRLRDGREIECSADHIWTVRDTAASTEDKLLKRTVNKTTAELIEGGLRRKGKTSKVGFRWKLPIMKAIQYPHRNLALDPYVLGLLIGDGTLGGAGIVLTCAVDRTHLIDSIQHRLPADYCFDKIAPHNPADLRWALNYHDPILKRTNNALNIYTQEIHRLGLDCKTEHKFIPEEYLHADEQQRRELLAGLLDSDGTVAPRGQIRFCTIAERLKDDFCELVHSLGYACSVRTDNRAEKYTTGVAYDISIWTNDTLNLLPEKARRSDDHRASLPRKRPEVLPAKDADAPDTDLPLSPYLMGRICRSSMVEKNPVCVTSYSDEDRSLLSSEVEQIGCKLTVQVAEKRNTHRKQGVRSFTRHRIVKAQGQGRLTNPIIDILRGCGMYGTTEEESFFPEEYLGGSVRQRKELLQGIMDSFGKIKESYPYVSTKNERFRDEFVRLAESLGYAVETRTQTQPTPGGGSHSFETVRFLNADPSIFLMSPDRELFEGMCESFDDLGADDGFVAITDIVKTGEKAPMTCLYVDSPDHLFVAGDYVVTHNTTVAGMIGVQLNWCFNREVMMKRSTSWVSRVLVLSLNEFDDLSVKGIGYDNPIGSQKDGKNIAELLRRIEEFGGEPEWDDIAECFATNKENYVYYVPSLTLKERLDLNIEITAEDYKKIITVCSKFFGFIVLDMPDIMYDHKEGLVEFALNNAHIITYIMEPNTKSATLLMQLIEGLRDKDGNLLIDRDQWMVIVNKYATADNPYLGYIDDPANFGQVSLDAIRSSVEKFFFDIQAIPLTSHRDQGNIIFGRDPNVKRAARDIVDSILAQMDTNDGKIKVVRDTKGGGRRGLFR